MVQVRHYARVLHCRNNAASFFIFHRCLTVASTTLFKGDGLGFRTKLWPYSSFFPCRFVHATSGGATGLDSGISEGEKNVGVNQTDSNPPDKVNNQSIDAITKNLVVSTTSASWRDQMPETLKKKGPKTFQKVQLGLCDIYILGTIHVSKNSRHEVQQLLEHVHPQCIFVELCDLRMRVLEGINATTTDINELKNMNFMNKVKYVQEGQGGNFLLAACIVMLSSAFEDVATELDVELGGEFRSAYTYWAKTTKNKTTDDWSTELILGDQPVDLTLTRAWESLTWISKVKLFLGLIYASLWKPNKEEIQKFLHSMMEHNSDVLTESLEELRKHFPTLYTTIVVERDAWMAAKLVQTSRNLVPSNSSMESSLFNNNNNNNNDNNNNSRATIVAIVGAGHVPGIYERLTNPTSNDTPEEVIRKLVQTKRWANDEFVQKELIPWWINDVTLYISSEEDE